MPPRVSGFSGSGVRRVPLHIQFPNLELHVRRCMRICAITMLPARVKYVGLYCSVRNMQGPPIHARKDVAIMMAVLLDDWGVPGSVRLADATIKLERKLTALLCLQFPNVRPPPAVAPLIDN